MSQPAKTWVLLALSGAMGLVAMVILVVALNRMERTEAKRDTGPAVPPTVRSDEVPSPRPSPDPKPSWMNESPAPRVPRPPRPAPEIPQPESPQPDSMGEGETPSDADPMQSDRKPASQPPAGPTDPSVLLEAATLKVNEALNEFNARIPTIADVPAREKAAKRLYEVCYEQLYQVMVKDRRLREDANRSDPALRAAGAEDNTLFVVVSSPSGGYHKRRVERWKEFLRAIEKVLITLTPRFKNGETGYKNNAEYWSKEIKKRKRDGEASNPPDGVRGDAAALCELVAEILSGPSECRHWIRRAENELTSMPGGGQ